MKKIILIVSVIFLSISLHASVFNGEIKSFKQPDGSSVDLKLFGNEYYMRAESIDGYTLIRDKKTNWICYAQLTSNKTELISCGIQYKGTSKNIASLKSDLPFPKHLDISEKARLQVINKNKSLLGVNKIDPSTNKTINNAVDQSIAGTPIHPVSGNIKGLCIVVDFADEVGTLPMSEFEAFCNDISYSNFGNNGSLRTFYNDISGGLVDYENVVYGYYRAPLTFAQYDAMPYAQGAQQILGEALNWIENQGFDFSTLTTNPDGTIQAINLMYTGHPPTWAQGMWFHKGNYTGFSADGVGSSDYNCSPANDPLELAVVAHENGHMIGKWPDTYKYGNDTGPNGIGSFDLMCYYGSLTNPVPPNPLFRSNAGWGRIVDVTNYNGINIDTANSMTCFKYRNLNDTNEFFLLESKLRVGRSAANQDDGLTIWHIDRNGDNQSWHHEVFLEHANNDSTDHSQACFKQSFNQEFSANTFPNSNFYGGDPSGLRVWDIGPDGTIMNYKLGTGIAGPSLNLIYTSISNDDNSNGFIEPNESANINIDAANFGQLNSANATITCTAFGTNSSYITINTAPINIGVINVNQTIPVTFNFSVAANTPIGTAINFKFLISDGNDSTYITRQYIVGYVVVMNNNTAVSNCNALFYDQGILNSYNDNTNFTKTFNPVNAGDKVRVSFSEFELEDFTNCGYDYLKIYNGPNTASALIGTYCGVNSPGTVTSTHTSGALTFRFHSDPGVTAAGWKAIVSCIAGVGINELENTNEISIYPNPSAGLYTLNLPENETFQISIVDLMGREVFAKALMNTKNASIDISNQASGLYMIKLKSNNRTLIKKLVLEK